MGHLSSLQLKRQEWIQTNDQIPTQSWCKTQTKQEEGCNKTSQRESQARATAEDSKHQCWASQTQKTSQKTPIFPKTNIQYQQGENSKSYSTITEGLVDYQIWIRIKNKNIHT